MAKPKSPILICPEELKNILPGLRSLCITSYGMGTEMYYSVMVTTLYYDISHATIFHELAVNSQNYLHNYICSCLKPYK